MTTREHEDETPPWVIPVREPDPSVTAPSTAGLGQAVAVLVLGVVAFAAAMVFGAGILVEDSDGGDAGTEVAADDSGSEAGGDEHGSTRVEADGVVAGPTSTTAESGPTSEPDQATSTTTSTSTTSTSTTTATTTTTTTAVEAGHTGSVPQLSSSFGGGWVAQLTSVPQRSGVDRLEEAWDALRTDVSDAVVAVSDEWSTLRPGYWVFVHAGPFGSSQQASDFCERVDRECIPRELRP